MRIQNEDIKSEAELIAAGATRTKLIHDLKIYLTSYGLNLTLKEAIDNMELGDSAPPLRLFATPTPDSKLNIAPSQIVSRDGTTKLPPMLASVINLLPATTIDFQTGSQTGGTTGGTVSISRPLITTGQFVILALEFLFDGSLKATFSSPSSSLGGLVNPGGLFTTADSFPVGYVYLECTANYNFKTAGSSTNVIQNKVGANSRIFRFMISGSGGGGGGGGSFDVDDILVNNNGDVLTNANFNVLLKG